jgi:hypothetical protein
LPFFFFFIAMVVFLCVSVDRRQVDPTPYRKQGWHSSLVRATGKSKKPLYFRALTVIQLVINDCSGS